MNITISAALLQTLIEATNEAERQRDYDAERNEQEGDDEQAAIDRETAAQYALAVQEATSLL